MDTINAAVPIMPVHQFIVELGQQQIKLITKPGLPGWNTISPSARLFIENAHIDPVCSILLYGVHGGTLATYLSHAFPQASIAITDRDYASLKMARQTLDANHIESVDVFSNMDLIPGEDGKYQVVFIQLPKGRQLVRRYLLQAIHLTAVGGTLYLAGANNLGIQSAIKDGHELFGNSSLLAYKRGNRIARLIKQPHSTPGPSWSTAPGIAPGTWCDFNVAVRGHTLHIHSLPGVFSYDRLDEGTQLLLNTITFKLGARVLDVGCGYGIIGMLAALGGAAEVHLVDTDLLAIASCVESLALNHIVNAKVYASDLLESVSTDTYDQILSNPPFHSGQAVDYQVAEAVIGQAFFALHPGGEFTIVANRFIRYERMINSIFGNVTILAESGKFHVISGLKSI